MKKKKVEDNMDDRKAFTEIDMTAAMKSLESVKESIRSAPKLENTQNAPKRINNLQKLDYGYKQSE